MVDLYEGLPLLAFPPDLDTIVFERDGTAAGGSFRLLLKVGALVVFDTALRFADGEALFSLEDLGALLAAHLGDKPAVMTLQIDGAMPYACTLLPGRRRLRMSAERFTARRFLTLWSDAKPTAYDSLEHLAFYQGAPATVALEYRIFKPDGTFLFSKAAQVGFTEAGIHAFKFRFSEVFPSLPEELRRSFVATVRADGRKMGYRAVERPYGAEEVAFTNCFGQPETLMFARTERRSKAVRTAAVAGGRRVNRDVADDTEFEGVTLPLPDGGLEPFADFLLSTGIVRLADGCPLALTDGELKESSGADALTRGTAVWQEERKHRGIGRRRIFDHTFDKTFE